VPSAPDAPEPFVPSDRTLLEVLDDLKAEGFTHDVRVTEDGELCCRECGYCVPAEDMELLTLRRVEGASDPGDEAAVLGLPLRRLRRAGSGHRPLRARGRAR